MLWWYSLCLITGITTAFYITPPYALCTGALIIFMTCWLNEYWPLLLKKISPYVVLCAMGYVLLHTQMANHRVIINTYSGIPLRCQGRVIEYTPTPHLVLKHKITLRLQSVSTNPNNHWEKLPSQLISIHTKQSYEHLVGSDIVVSDIVIKPSSQSFELFCIRMGFIGAAHKPQLTYTVINRPRYSLTRFVQSYKRKMLTFFKHHMNAQTFTFFSTLFLGNSDFVKNKLKQSQASFQQWGIMHYLARSGLHLVIVTALLEYMLYILPWSFSVGRIAILCCAFLYEILSWTSLSFSRALTAFTLTYIARIARKQHHFLHIILLTCCIFLVINPITLFFLDFQLTFGITIGLGFFNYATYASFI